MKKQKKLNSKKRQLRLTTTTIRSLSPDEARRAAGGFESYTNCMDTEGDTCMSWNIYC